jgi:seryl-tRNA synthetase
MTLSASGRRLTDDEFRGELRRRALLVETGVAGIYGRSATFEAVMEGCIGAITSLAAGDGCVSMRFPPVLPRRELERLGYLQSFPHLAGTVFAFEGDAAEAARQLEQASRHEDWSGFQTMTDLVLTPAACYPVYPAVAAGGVLDEDGVTVDPGAAYVFRHEPSEQLTRMQMFHQRELVRIGRPERVREWRELWKGRLLAFLLDIGLDARLDVATDPFFGRGGRMLAINQREQELKYELSVPILGHESTAVASVNYHEDRFASLYGLTFADGSLAHTACLGVGIERLTLALMRRHGLSPDLWPRTVRDRLR